MNNKIYQVIRDKSGYVDSVTEISVDQHIITSTTKPDVEEYKLHAYKYRDGEFILDEEKEKEIEEQRKKDLIQRYVNELKGKLNESDYIIARAFEEVMALDNKLTWIVDVIKIMAKYTEKYKDDLANRKAWREEIEEIENK